LQGKFSDYSIQKNAIRILIQDSMENRDGSIEARNIETIKFQDQSRASVDF
jgi:hypothetical protein